MRFWSRLLHRHCGVSKWRRVRVHVAESGALLIEPGADAGVDVSMLLSLALCMWVSMLTRMQPEGSKTGSLRV